jgi:hypothetical protein
MRTALLSLLFVASCGGGVPKLASVLDASEADEGTVVDTAPLLKRDTRVPDLAPASEAGAGIDLALASDAPSAPTDGASDRASTDGAPPAGATDGPAAGGPLVEHVVLPKTADPTADQYLDGQYAYLDPGATGEKLVVYLGYSKSKPADHTAMLKVIASFGFPVISPQYANDAALLASCRDGSDPDVDCFYKVRLEVLDGTDHSAHLNIKKANSTEERIVRLLQYLDGHFPGEGWGRFLDGANPLWSAIVISGHSQGAASSALISKVRPVARAVLFAGPDDAKASGAAARWPGVAGITPADRLWGFVNKMDTRYSDDSRNWTALGFGAAQAVDGQSSPYMNAHRLETNLAPPSGVTNGAHLMIVAAPSSPMQGGGYLYLPVWRALFGTP